MESMPTQMTGFYRDPRSGSVRRWDGSAWRELPPLVTPPSYALPVGPGSGHRDEANGPR